MQPFPNNPMKRKDAPTEEDGRSNEIRRATTGSMVHSMPRLPPMQAAGPFGSTDGNVPEESQALSVINRSQRGRPQQMADHRISTTPTVPIVTMPKAHYDAILQKLKANRIQVNHL
jgi:hypothetical protein